MLHRRHLYVRAMCRREVWSQELHGYLKNYINKDFDPRRTKQKGRDILQKTIPSPLYVHFSYHRLSLTQPTNLLFFLTPCHTILKKGWLKIWHINFCGLFNAISSLHIYIRYINDLWTHFIDCIFKWAGVHFFCTQLHSFKYFYETVTI